VCHWYRFNRSTSLKFDSYYPEEAQLSATKQLSRFSLPKSDRFKLEPPCSLCSSICDHLLRKHEDSEAPQSYAHMIPFHSLPIAIKLVNHSSNRNSTTTLWVQSLLGPRYLWWTDAYLSRIKHQNGASSSGISSSHHSREILVVGLNRSQEVGRMIEDVRYQNSRS